MTKLAGKSSPDTETLWHAISESKFGLDPALTIPDRLVAPDSWAGHLPFAFWIVAVSQPRRVVELGVHTGNSYCTFAQAVSKYQLDTECFGIDHWFGDEQAGLYGEDVYADLKAWHDPRFGHFSRLLRMSFADGRSHIEDGSVDLLHIDGLHTYEAVREDFETWVPKMSDRCIVLFHDTTVFQDDFGVCDYFQEIKARYPTFEFLHSNGLGVAYTGSRPVDGLDPVLAKLFSASNDVKALATVRSCFSLLGDAHIRSIRIGDTRAWGEDILSRLNDVNLELGKVVTDRARIQENRDNLLTERSGLIDKALKWDQLAVNTGGAISLDLQEISAALNALYNSDNPQALRDREILRKELRSLIDTGSFLPRPEKPVTQLSIVLSKYKRRLLDRTTPRNDDPMTFEADPPPIDKDISITTIRNSGLFDENHYALTDAAKSAGQDPLEHYLQTGEGQRLAPSAAFDPDYYARRNPDVAKSGFGLLRHFVLFGQAEDRPCLTPAKRMMLPELADSDRPRILLLVEPDLKDGDRAFTLNVVSSLQGSHDVVLLLQHGDAQADALAQTGASILVFPEEADIEAIDRNETLDRIVNELKPEFGIAMSVHSRVNVRGLAAAGLGMVQLVDEYSSSVRPFGSAYEFLPWAHRLVFPSTNVAESFKAEHPYLSRRQMDVIAPPAWKDDDATTDAGVERQIRPEGQSSDIVVAAGGDLGPQSGIEAFIALAVKTGPKTAQGKSLRYVWLTHNHDGHNGSSFARLVSEQIRRAGVDDYCEIVNLVAGIEIGLRYVDIFALTSPIDAMSHLGTSAALAGKPVICFKGGSSVAEVLETDPATAFLVSPYLDLSAMTETIHKLAKDDSTFETVSKACVVLGESQFEIGAYTEKLIRFGKQAQTDAKRIGEDYQILQAAEPPVFDEDLFAGVWSADKYPQDFLHTYLLRSRVSRLASDLMPPDLRRPRAGFNPLIYFEDQMNQDSPRDPLANWFEAGQPEGRWTHQVLELSGAKPGVVDVKTLLHAHFYYVDLIDDFLAKLQSNASAIDLIVTVPDEQRAEAALQALARVSLPGLAKVEVVRNIGRDIGPFLNGLDQDVLGQYDVIGHIHGKKSPHVDSVTGDNWRNFLWEHLIGGANAAADACLEAFKTDPSLGLVFPEDPHLIGWDRNLPMAKDLVRKMGRATALPRAFDWPVGTMFWARCDALKPLFELGLDWSDYPAEPLPEDGSLLHALERVIPFAVEQAGFGYAATHLPEVQR